MCVEACVGRGWPVGCGCCGVCVVVVGCVGACVCVLGRVWRGGGGRL